VTASLRQLGSDEVHVWLITLDQTANEHHFVDLLSADERERAARFQFPLDRQRFVRARAALRSLITQYSGIPLNAVTFGYGRFGKPFLAGSGSCALRFNVSRSAGFALIALASGRELGVDIQQESDDIDFLPVAERCFSAADMAAVLQFDESERRREFFRIWARKEAYMKATGTGFSGPARAPADQVSDRDRWVITDLAMLPGFTCALAVEAPGLSIVEMTCGIDEFIAM
jgi:4'-phosphopantetheinyl transferase